VDEAHSDDGMSVICDLFTQIFTNPSLTKNKNYFMGDGSIFIGF
jgi:hypothetical protein